MENPNDASVSYPVGKPSSDERNNPDIENGGGNGGGNLQSNNGALDPAAEVKRGRGRPKGSGKRSANIDASGNVGNETGKKPVAKAPLDVSSLATQLEGLHKIVAVFFKNPTIVIDADEAKKLAIALQTLSKQYNIGISPVVMAWAQLAGVSAAIYGPRIMLNVAVKQAAIAERKKAEVFATAGSVSNALSTEPNSVSQPGKMKFQ